MSTRTGTAIVFAAAALLYALSVGNGFAYDDNPIILLDDRIHHLGAALHVFVQPYWPSPEIGLYRPLVSLTYVLDWAVSGGSPAWFHAMNVLWNAAACALVFRFLCAFADPPVALAGALLFASHPVHTEAVANVVGRAELMAAVFCLAALTIWVRTAPMRMPRRRAAAVLSLYVLALLSKESAVMLPALLALADAARGALLPATARDWLRRNAVMFAVFGVIAVAFIAVRFAVLGAMAPTLRDPVLDVAQSPLHRLWTALQAWPMILRLLVFPRVLLADYGPGVLLPAMGPTPDALLGATLLATLVGAGLVAGATGRGRLAFTLLFVPVALLPTSNLLLPIGVVLAERTLYLPSLAVAAALTFLASHAWEQQRHRTIAIGVTAVLVAMFSVRTMLRVPDWASTPAVMAALERDRPDSYRAHWYFAQRAVNLEQPDEALQRYARAMNIWPYREPLALEAASFAARAGDHDFADQVTRFALAQWPDHVGFLRLHAAIQLERGLVADAAATIERGLRLAPDDSLLRAMRQSTAGKYP